MGERSGAYSMLVGNLRERYHLEDLTIDWRGSTGNGIGGMDWIDLAAYRDRCSNDPLGVLQCREFCN
jgi:hypothetical protein